MRSSSILRQSQHHMQHVIRQPRLFTYEYPLLLPSQQQQQQQSTWSNILPYLIDNNNQMWQLCLCKESRRQRENAQQHHQDNNERLEVVVLCWTRYALLLCCDVYQLRSSFFSCMQLCVTVVVPRLAIPLCAPVTNNARKYFFEKNHLHIIT